MNGRYVICVDHGDWPASLQVLKLYRVLPDADGDEIGWIRVMDETDEDYLYPADCFVPVELSDEAEQAIASVA